jgi:MFS family permease
VRAAGYGFSAVLLGALLAARGYSHLRAGVVLTALIAGTALSSLVVGALADRVGRRRSYAVFFLGVAAAGAVVAAGAPFWLLLVVALTGTLSTDVVDNGPATTLEQAMLAGQDAGTARLYGTYNAVGATAGALGALAAVLPGVNTGTLSGRLFAVLVPVGLLGAALASRLSPSVEASTAPTLAHAVLARARLGPSRRVVHRLAGLFAVDAGGGGLVTTGFLTYYFAQRYAVPGAGSGHSACGSAAAMAAISVRSAVSRAIWASTSSSRRRSSSPAGSHGQCPVSRTASRWPMSTSRSPSRWFG